MKYFFIFSIGNLLMKGRFDFSYFYKTSVPKDTVLLRELYWKAGVTEYWLVDVRDGNLSFEILQGTPKRQPLGSCQTIGIRT